MVQALSLQLVKIILEESGKIIFEELSLHLKRKKKYKDLTGSKNKLKGSKINKQKEVIENRCIKVNLGFGNK